MSGHLSDGEDHNCSNYQWSYKGVVSLLKSTA